MKTKLTHRLGLVFYLLLLGFATMVKAHDASLFYSIRFLSTPRTGESHSVSEPESVRRLELTSHAGTGASPRKLVSPQRNTAGAGWGLGDTTEA
jgi:hypothetical protein